MRLRSGKRFDCCRGNSSFAFTGSNFDSRWSTSDRYWIRWNQTLRELCQQSFQTELLMIFFNLFFQVAAFGGDQFKIPEQAKQLATFFSFFYFSINAGSLISTYLMPILREDVHCFGDLDCFSLAFGIPGALMVVSIFVFVAGRKLYTVKKPTGNVIVDVTKCVIVRPNITFHDSDK